MKNLKRLTVAELLYDIGNEVIGSGSGNVETIGAGLDFLLDNSVSMDSKADLLIYILSSSNILNAA